jgi:hypothetical protein
LSRILRQKAWIWHAASGSQRRKQISTGRMQYHAHQRHA